MPAHLHAVPKCAILKHVADWHSANLIHVSIWYMFQNGTFFRMACHANLKHVSGRHIFQNSTPCQSETFFRMAHHAYLKHVSEWHTMPICNMFQDGKFIFVLRTECKEMYSTYTQHFKIKWIIKQTLVTKSLSCDPSPADCKGFQWILETNIIKLV